MYYFTLFPGIVSLINYKRYFNPKEESSIIEKLFGQVI